jgi:RNA polymerase sigma-70 factor
VRASAVHLAIDMIRQSRRTETELLDQLSDPVCDAELAVIKKQVQEHLGEALRHAWKSLKPNHRLALKLQLQDHLGIDEMAQLFHCHRSSAARRVVSARSELVRLTRQYLTTHLSLGRASIDEGLSMVNSQFRSILSQAFRDVSG